MQKTRSILLATATILIGGIGGLPSTASACNSEPYIGSICTFAFDWCPREYILADGRTLNIREYQALFALIGFRYGGDNATVFAIPDLRGRAVYGTGKSPVLPNTIGIGQQFGVQQVTLNYTQVPIPPHTHPASFSPTYGGSPAVASGPASLNLNNAPVTGLSVTSTPSLSGTVNVPAPTIAQSGTGGSATPVANGSLGKAGNAGASLYGSTAADTVIGKPTNNVPVTVGGTIANTVSGGTVSGVASGTVTLPVTGGQLVTGGTVTVGANTGSGTAAQATITQSPGLGQTVCIAALGLYPNRP
ncbi:phage tail protein [Azospirillum sp. B510]|uniref:phage tail protein n=1 Tax=Azospirillum sp. (strain B510) TaxID=137722 RepID=UPI00030FFE2B|nr:tail fiber protein [Azospirillum sp. B510]